jgi:hypothetical protein
MADAAAPAAEPTEGYSFLTEDGGVQIKVHSEGNGTKPRTGEEVVGELRAHTMHCAPCRAFPPDCL